MNKENQLEAYLILLQTVIEFNVALILMKPFWKCDMSVLFFFFLFFITQSPPPHKDTRTRG